MAPATSIGTALAAFARSAAAARDPGEIGTELCARLSAVLDVAGAAVWLPAGEETVPAAAELVGTVVLPIGGTEPVGVLELRAPAPRQWTPEELATAQAFADIAAVLLDHAAELAASRRRADQLQAALDSRVLIEQAKGMIAEHRGVDVEEAFRRLRRHANDHNAKLHDVARAVVTLGLRP